MNPHPPVYETLVVNSRHGGAQVTVDRVEPSGQTTPVWVFNKSDKKTAALLYANAANDPNAPAAGTIRHHSVSVASDISLRGGPVFKMKIVETDYPVRKQEFTFNGARFTWGKDDDTLSPRKLSFKDAVTGQVLGRYRKYPNGRSAGARPTFELFIPTSSIDMDMFIVTGMSSMDTWDGEEAAGFKLLGKLVGIAG
ncbi:hypothetical protein B0T11DRAFT_334333 [Plectosphaerella cucumerina]|jgi:hypothetical protein|uniref:Uncharacterized protein n=1 Tax=Plectosphaerella cucumerina TaxID=40658 RepID=A0A8K0TMA2_9PEZI|nr:hypothetical protein B0T11DRAFT_334333 [Plectosphaerella cucumerina]